MLLACSAKKAPEATPNDVATPVPDTVSFERSETTQFSDVLAEYQALNARLARIAAPLRLENHELCPATERDPGFITHRLADYPEPLQEVAQELLGLEPQGLFIRTVRNGSPADKADIGGRRGDCAACLVRWTSRS